MHGTSSRAKYIVSRSDWKYLHFVGWVLFAGLVVLLLNQCFQETKERDFVYFYSIGRILNEHPPEQLYQYSLQKKTFDEVLPRKSGTYGPSPYPPFVAMLFRAFARLPYWTACRLWMGISFSLYLAGLWLLTKRFTPNSRLLRSLLFCFALIFWPAIAWMVLGGQLSGIGFFAMALALCLEDSDRQFLSGLALSICVYKPTLLVLLLPMLLVIRRFKTLAGFGLGTAIVTVVTTLAAGPRIWLAYARMSAEFAHMRPNLQLQNYVDITAFSSMLAHGVPFIRGVVLCAGLIAGAYLVRVWWSCRQGAQGTPATAIWATTITWTLLLNVYVPHYDSVLVVSSLIPTAYLLRRIIRPAFIVCVLLLIFSYLSLPIAEACGVQITTILFAALGILQLRFCCLRPVASHEPDFSEGSDVPKRLVECGTVLGA